MGWQVKHTDKGYQIKSTITGKLIHKQKWMSEQETKALMIEVELFNFFEKLIKIDKDFLYGYNVNGSRNIKGEPVANQWLMDNEDKIFDEGQDILYKHMQIKLVEK